MTDTFDPNPFAAPQAKPHPAERGEATEEMLLTFTEVEFSRTTRWIWCAGGMFTVFCLFSLILMIVALSARTASLQFLATNFLIIALNGTASILLFRCAIKMRLFCDHPQIPLLVQSLEAHAAFWKYLGITFVLGLFLLAPYLLLDVLRMGGVVEL